MGRINEYPVAEKFEDNDSVLGLVDGKTSLVKKNNLFGTINSWITKINRHFIPDDEGDTVEVRASELVEINAGEIDLNAYTLKNGEKYIGVIDDTNASSDRTYSSEKIQNGIDGIGDSLTRYEEEGYLPKNILAPDVLAKATSTLVYYPYKLKPNTRYTLSTNLPKTYNGNAAYILILRGNVSTGGGTANDGVWDGQSRTILTDSNGYLTVAIRNSVNDGVSSLIPYQTQLEEGAAVTSYVPYCPPNTEIANNANAVNDLKMLGWAVPKEFPIQNYVDANKVFHQRVGRICLADLNWVYSLWNDKDSFYAENTGILTKVVANNVPASAYVDRYSIVSHDANRAGNADNALSIYTSTSLIYVRDYSKGSDINAFKSFIKGVYLYYELAEEILIPMDGHEAVTELKQSLNGFKTSHFSKSFAHSLTKEVFEYDVPNFETFCEVNILLSHVQDLYGKYVKLFVRRIGDYVTTVEVASNASSPIYNDFTYAMAGGFQNGKLKLTLNVTTGNALSHDLTIDCVCV